MGVGAIILIGLMAATVIALVIGITLMARGGEANRKYGNRMMVLRVTLQGLALALVALLLLIPCLSCNWPTGCTSPCSSVGSPTRERRIC